MNSSRAMARNLPYDDDSFDVSYTNLVLEQIPDEDDHVKVLMEMKRVTRGICCFLEPWADAQNLLTFRYLVDVHYFRQKSRMLEKLGFKDVEFS